MLTETLLVLTGISGAGKSAALDALEDVGFFCVDNLPGPLIHSFVDFLLNLPSEWKVRKQATDATNFALLVDCRDEDSVEAVVSELARVRQAGIEARVLFFDCRDDVIVRRYQESRRPHPYNTNQAASGIRDAIAKERIVLSKLREVAEQVIDTSATTTQELRKEIQGVVQRSIAMETTLLTFGFKYGPPKDADLVLDVRFLPNPFYIPEMRELTGVDPSVSNYVLADPEAISFLSHLRPLLNFLLPRYAREGKRYLTIGIGCTGGRHRSVAIAEKLALDLNASNQAVTVSSITVKHRDRDR